MIVTLLTILLGIALLATLGILLVGLVGMTRPDFNTKYGNKVMRFRVASQLVCVVLFVLLLLARAA